MFHSSTYAARRERLTADVGSGLVLFLGNGEAPMNYGDNHYAFRQDSTFLYFFGIDAPDFAAVIDVDARQDTILADDFSVDDIIWRGPQPKVAELAARVG